MSELESSKQDNVALWSGFWDTGDTGWHLSKMNPALAKHGEKFLGSDPNTSILFPLCGKTLDMTLLASKFQVAGIEGVKQPLDDFAQENQSELVREAHDDLAPYEKYSVRLESQESKPVVDLYLGDFFAFKSDGSVPARTFDRVFDRGSLVAIKPFLRREYMQIINALLKPGGKWMIASIAYDQSLYPGPPHSLSADDVLALLAQLEQDTGDKYTLEVWEHYDAAKTGVVSRFLQSNGGPLSTYDDFTMVITKSEVA